ncbi:GntR family transcriptional regulator [Synergistaceae bacterium OttesenSCG-928-I11]|nr:GntR family transcriptional regulator [Synergistaceae bacterium OttesenSCG-928-I11]
MEIALHHRIYMSLRKEIESGAIAFGDTIPSESELQKKFNVSRAPVRQALARLEAEFFVEKKQGKGTFVTYSRGQGPWYAVGGLREDYRRDWKKQRSLTLSIERIPQTPYLLERNVFPGEAEIIWMRRLRFVDDTPIYYLNQYLSGALDETKIVAQGNFLNTRKVMYELFGFETFQVHEEVSAVIPPPYVAEALGLSDGKPLLQIEAVAYTRDFDIVYCNVDYVDSDHWKYKLRTGDLRGDD